MPSTAQTTGGTAPLAFPLKFVENSRFMSLTVEPGKEEVKFLKEPVRPVYYYSLDFVSGHPEFDCSSAAKDEFIPALLSQIARIPASRFRLAAAVNEQIIYRSEDSYLPISVPRCCRLISPSRIIGLRQANCFRRLRNSTICTRQLIATGAACKRSQPW